MRITLPQRTGDLIWLLDGRDPAQRPPPGATRVHSTISGVWKIDVGDARDLRTWFRGMAGALRDQDVQASKVCVRRANALDEAREVAG